MSEDDEKVGRATFIKQLRGWRGDARLYRVDPPMKMQESYNDDVKDGDETNYVIVSAVVVPYDFGGPETYIFPALENGETVNMIELEGSYKGGLDHTAALRGAGYDVRDGNS